MNKGRCFCPPAHAYVDQSCRPSAGHAAQLAYATNEFTATARGGRVMTMAKSTVKSTTAHGPPLAIFELGFPLTIGWCPEKLVMISLTVQGLSRWQTNNVSHKQTMPKTISAFVAGDCRHQRPVRCMLDRDEDMAMTGHRHPYSTKYRVWTV